MGTNEKADRFVLAAQAVVLAVLVWVGWQVRELRPKPDDAPMTRTTEWTTPAGVVERFTSTRERGQAFNLFNEVHRQAVKEIQEPR